jgi:peptide-methionine (S)-S-oxide reductase
MATELATLGGGCFWCIEAALQQLKGVSKVVSGYAGGAMADPDYDAVCTGRTGHAEVVQATFDPAVIPYRTLLQAFFSVHDPTTKDRQGADVGTQYRSVIFTHSPQQAATAKALIEELQKDVFGDPIVTQVLPAPRFYPAEAYHQGYYDQNPEQGYCQAVIAPKLAKLRKSWAPLLKA